MMNKTSKSKSFFEVYHLFACFYGAVVGPVYILDIVSKMTAHSLVETVWWALMRYDELSIINRVLMWKTVTHSRWFHH